jgi:membrane-bound metal-dependent hydrolase YbcI (DUF457 family)
MPSPIGHALAGAAAAWAVDLVPGRRAWRTAPPTVSFYARAGNGLTLTCALLGIAPDLDLLLPTHRTITHSIGAVMFVALFAAALAANARRPVARVAVMCAAAWATHVVLDWLGADHFPPYGIRALWPFDNGWYISGLDLFRPTERHDAMSAAAVMQNVMAIASELAILLPIAVAIWLVRIKALARLSTEVASGNHAA